MRSWKAVTLTSGTKAYWIIGAMISTVITARLLGPHGRGVIAAAMSWVTMFSTFGHLSLASVIVYLLGRQERDRNLPAVAGSVMAITAATTLLGWTIVLLMDVFSGGRIFQNIPAAALVVAFAGLPLLLWMENGNSLLIVLGDLKRVNLAQFAGTTTTIVLVLIAVGVLHLGVVGALGATVASYAILNGIVLSRVLRESGRLSISREVVRGLLGGGIRLHVAAVGTFLFTQAGVILLNQFRPVAEAGFFQLAMQMTAATQVVPMAVGIVAYSLVARHGPEAAWREHRILVLQTMLYAALAAAVSYLAAPWIVPLLAGRGFEPAVPILRILTLSVFGMSVATVMAPQWVARGYFLHIAALAVVAGAISLIGNFLFIPRYGMYACAWAMVASYAVYLAGNVAFGWWIERRRREAPALEPVRG